MPDKSKEKKRARGSSSTDPEEEDKVLEKLTSIQTRIEDGFTKMENEMVALKQELKQDILAVRNELDDLRKSIDSAWVEIDILKNENKYLKNQVASTASKNAKLNEEVSALKDRVIRQEDYSRRENLRFYNIPENQGESIERCITKVNEVITALGLSSSEISFHAIHRIGKRDNLSSLSSSHIGHAPANGHPQRSRPRPILVRFVSRMDADAVWGRRKELLNSSSLSSIFIDKDFSAETAKIHKKAKELNIARVFIKGNKLLVNNSSYVYSGQYSRLPAASHTGQRTLNLTCPKTSGWTLFFLV